ncbi:guanine nucleotide-binding protein G(I)/G(S)/G(O) subunit gamma-8 isoform X1 [Oryx dammah]|uniref:guanine nucleotide-binding protein G(I)/G(S)/G(O) subunit gamma-8 isoform X1 n=1 Tax=Oryx dammah TaxID=59534 RepID=UPI001A9BCFF2|nr:guanine nucleotide-binding protein G(I)/G(S)/G(O) subunit gamma-8 isoform X1 [Oryx dammah]
MLVAVAGGGGSSGAVPQERGRGRTEVGTDAVSLPPACLPSPEQQQVPHLCTPPSLLLALSSLFIGPPFGRLLGPPSTQISISPLFFCFPVSSSTLGTASVSPSTHAPISGFHHHRQPYLGTHLCPSLLLRPHSHRLLTFPRRSHVQQHGQDRGGPEDRGAAEAGGVAGSGRAPSLLRDSRQR